MTVNEELRTAEKTGEILLGSNQSLKTTKEGKAELVIISTTCPRDVEEKIKQNCEDNNILIHFYSGDGLDLGLALGEPFSVAVATVLDSGDSNVLDIGEEYQ